MKTIDQCPHPGCTKTIQATVKVYLTNVGIKDGRIASYDIEHVTGADAVRSMVNTAEGDELLIYCEDDHHIGLDGKLLLEA